MLSLEKWIMSQKRVPLLYGQLPISELRESSALRDLRGSGTRTRAYLLARKEVGAFKDPRKGVSASTHTPHASQLLTGRHKLPAARTQTLKPHLSGFELSHGCARHFTANVLKGKILKSQLSGSPSSLLWLSRWLERGYIILKQVTVHSASLLSPRKFYPLSGYHPQVSRDGPWGEGGTVPLGAEFWPHK